MDVAESLCLACTKYRADDDIAKLFAFICFVPYIALIYMAAAAHATRDVTAIFIALGALINAGLSMAVKQILRLPRPAATCAFIGKCHKYGMPSSHAQVMAYALTTELIMQSHRSRNREKINGSGVMGFFEFLELVFLAAISLCVATARIYLGYHSSGQVAAGVLLGSCFAAVWYLGFIMKLQSTGLATSIQELFSPLLHLRNTWEDGWVHNDPRPDKKNRKVR